MTVENWVESKTFQINIILKNTVTDRNCSVLRSVLRSLPADTVRHFRLRENPVATFDPVLLQLFRSSWNQNLVLILFLVCTFSDQPLSEFTLHYIHSFLCVKAGVSEVVLNLEQPTQPGQKPEGGGPESGMN